jgi:hypothetical protein
LRAGRAGARCREMPDQWVGLLLLVATVAEDVFTEVNGLFT